MGKIQEDMKTVNLKTCNDVIEANMLKNLLENEGINCFLINENISNLVPNFNGIIGSGVQVIIDEVDLEASLLIIKSHYEHKKVVCPNCQSSFVQYGFGSNKIKKISIILLSLLNGIPFGNIKRGCICKDCQSEFTL